MVPDHRRPLLVCVQPAGIRVADEVRADGREVLREPLQRRAVELRQVLPSVQVRHDRDPLAWHDRAENRRIVGKERRVELVLPLDRERHQPLRFDRGAEIRRATVTPRLPRRKIAVESVGRRLRRRDREACVPSLGVQHGWHGQRLDPPPEPRGAAGGRGGRKRRAGHHQPSASCGSSLQELPSGEHDRSVSSGHGPAAHAVPTFVVRAEPVAHFTPLTWGDRTAPSRELRASASEGDRDVASANPQSGPAAATRAASGSWKLPTGSSPLARRSR